jgi:hypothetical protein
MQNHVFAAPLGRPGEKRTYFHYKLRYTALKRTVNEDDAMTQCKLGLGLCAVLAWAVSVLPAWGQLNQQQIQIIKDTAASICNTVTEARGQKTDVQIQGDVAAKLGGLVGKVVDVGGSGKGSLTRDEFEGLSQDATAEALKGAQGCRERVFNKMFDKLSFEETKPREDRGATEAVARARAMAQAAATRGRDARDNAVRAQQMAASAQQRALEAQRQAARNGSTPNGDWYQGEFREGRRNGYGVQHSASDEYYEGEFHDDQRDGYGVRTVGNGQQEQGLWRNNRLIQGMIILARSSGDPNPYEGEWDGSNDNHGYGRYIHSATKSLTKASSEIFRQMATVY